MDPEAMRVAQAELRPGERLYWAGRPGRGALARSQLGATAAGVPFLAFSLFWMYMVGLIAGPIVQPAAEGFDPFGDMRWPFWLFGSAFVLIGVWMVLSAPLAFLRAGSTVYGVTDQRVFIRSGRRVRSWSASDINALERTERDDGSGDLRFRTESSHRGRRLTHHGFHGIPGVREVEARIAKLRETAAA